MKVVVRSVISECELEALPKTHMREIFDLMCKNLLVVEKWYFGLYYLGADHEKIWVDTSKKTTRDLRNVVTKLLFRVKYYPEDVGEDLIERTTIELFFTQVKTEIYKDDIYCPGDTCALLASYALQAKFGDRNTDENANKPLPVEKLIPERVLNQHRMDISDWTDTISNMWLKHKGLDPEDAMLEYLKLAQNLEMYGVSFFDIKNRKGTDLLLGVNALGLDIYKPDDKLNPQISFPWSEIKNLKFKDRKFTIKPADRASADFIFYTKDPKASKSILNLGVGNHTLYVRRRKPDSPEIVRMKARAKEMRKDRENQKNKLNRERAAREEIERREANYKAQIETMREEMERNKANLLEAQNTIQKLQQQLEELQQSKEELERQQHELKAMMERLEHNKNMEAAEKQALEDEIHAKQLEVQRIRDEVEAKDAETKRLQEEVEAARLREEEMQRLEEERRRQDEEKRLREEALNHNHEKELEELPEGADTALPETQQVNETLREQLRQLQEKLDESRNQNFDTDLDKIHRVNLREGRDKYKTLADIRRGNTVRRVEMFENL